MTADGMILAYNLTCLGIGLMSFSAIAIAVLLFRDRFTLRFFQFYVAFTMLAALSCLVAMVNDGHLSFRPGMYRVIFLLSLAANAWFIGALPDYIDYLKGHLSPRRRLLWLGVSLAFLLVSVLAAQGGGDRGMPLPALIALQGCFLAVVVYSFWDVKKSIREASASPESRFFRRFSLVGLCFLPGIVLDIFLSAVIDFRFTYALYALESLCFVGFVFQFMREVLASASAVAPLSLPDGFSARMGLSPRESEVLAFLLQGRNNREIAEALFVSVPTVKTHVQKIFRKTGVGSRFELIRFAAVPQKP
jgi:DNA-binding CsgD family transcriptional regulator